MNYAVILAGGIGSRMQVADGTPKQFLAVAEKPILIQTIEKFQKSKKVDKIVVSCVKERIAEAKELMQEFGMSKVIDVVEGGATYLLSAYNGVKKILEISNDPENDYVCICDGVRPLVQTKVIDATYDLAYEKGAVFSFTPATVSILILDDQDSYRLESTTDRDRSYMVQAPTTYRLSLLVECYERMFAEGDNEIKDTPTLLRKYGYEQYGVQGNSDNIKITNPEDYYVLKAILEYRKTKEVMGL